MTDATPAATIIDQGGHTVTVRIPVSFRQRGGRKQILAPSGAAPWSPAPRVDTALVKAIVRAHRWRQMLEGGEYASSAELAKAEKVNDSYLSRILRLTLLAPVINEAVLSGTQPRGLELSDLLKPFPIAWTEQSVFFGIDENPNSVFPAAQSHVRARGRYLAPRK
jgi:hypothetical protein